MLAALQRLRIPTLLSAVLTLLNDRLSESIVFPLLPFLLAQFAPDGRTLGLLAGSYALAQFLVTPLIGALSDRYGRRPVITTCVAGSVVGLGLFAITVSLPWPAGSSLPLLLLFAARIIDGVSGGTAATAGAVLADISPPDKRARAFGLIGVAFGLGFILGPFIGGQLARIAVPVPVWVATAFAVVNLAVVLLLLPETHPVEASTGWVSGSSRSTTARLTTAKAVATHTGTGTAIRASCPPMKGPRMKPSPKATPISPKARARLSGGLMSASTAPAVAAVPPLTPSMIRAANSRSRGRLEPAGQGRLTVIAKRPKPTTDPATQVVITGRRP